MILGYLFGESLKSLPQEPNAIVFHHQKQNKAINLTILQLFLGMMLHVCLSFYRVMLEIIIRLCFRYGVYFKGSLPIIVIVYELVILY